MNKFLAGLRRSEAIDQLQRIFPSQSRAAVESAYDLAGGKKRVAYRMLETEELLAKGEAAW
ncbi:hypothetical protein [Flavihumibacter petaseus]|uniref:Uncharacterized protein n=1 Tax=Flavihumibacter petaseus NBRC 106054 TaxID=1220578 RepID=A0A0E9N4M4_9BACT|nr:hypothetical protein [Flavihumibacter petaseus]GAO44897.1 hypothetical protein FPE01S_04_01400 [Flavihumibacter petaseus NBRC 106054]